MKYTFRKISHYAILFFFLLSYCHTYAQSQDKTIRITAPTSDITGIAKTIAAQTGWHYSLNMQNNSLKKTITLKPGNYTLNKILEQVKTQAKLSYKIVGTHIIFVDYVIKDKTATSNKTNATTKKTSHLLLPKKTPPTTSAAQKAIDTIPQKYSIIPVKKDSAISAKDIPPKAIDTIAIAPPAKLSAAEKDSLYNTTIKSAPRTTSSPRERKPLLFAKAGFAVDEIFYANAVLEGGFNFLYGIISYGSTFKTGGFRWGGGISFPLDEDNRLHITFTTGNMRKTFDFDTFPQLLKLKETLHRFGAAWSRQLNERISIQLQAHYNLLHKDYTRDDPTKPNPLFGDFDSKYYIIIPPYTLHKSTAATSVTKSWIGLQCTFFYKF